MKVVLRRVTRAIADRVSASGLLDRANDRRARSSGPSGTTSAAQRYRFFRITEPRVSVWPDFEMRTVTRKRAPLAVAQSAVERLKM